MVNFLKNKKVILSFGILIGLVCAILFTTIRRSFFYSQELTMPYDLFSDIRFEKSLYKGFEGLAMSINEEPFFGFYKDSDGEYSLYIVDGDNRRLVKAEFTKGRITELAIVNNLGINSFFMDCRAGEGQWEAMYFKRDQAGQLYGNLYEDIDFDGTFDLISVFDSQSNFKNTFIIRDNVNYVTKDYDDKTRTVLLEEDGREKSYKFIKGSGWQEIEIKEN